MLVGAQALAQAKATQCRTSCLQCTILKDLICMDHTQISLEEVVEAVWISEEDEEEDFLTDGALMGHAGFSEAGHLWTCGMLEEEEGVSLEVLQCLGLWFPHYFHQVLEVRFQEDPWVTWNLLVQG